MGGLDTLAAIIPKLELKHATTDRDFVNGHQNIPNAFLRRRSPRSSRTTTFTVSGSSTCRRHGTLCGSSKHSAPLRTRLTRLAGTSISRCGQQLEMPQHDGASSHP
jgi:hypothetical protein